MPKPNTNSDPYAPYTVWYVDPLETRHRIKTFETMRAAESKAHRVYRAAVDAFSAGSYVHITDGTGETIYSREII